MGGADTIGIEGYDWNDRVTSELKDKSSDELTKVLSVCCIRDLIDNHAYSPEEITVFCEWAKIDLSENCEHLLIRELDIFAAYVGWKSIRGIDLTTAKRILELEKSLLAPAKNLLTQLNKQNLALEFVQDRQILSSRCRTDLIFALNQLSLETQEHISDLKQKKRNGQRSLAEEKAFHVEAVEMFLDHLDSPIRPKRTNLEETAEFLQIVRLLAKPIFRNIGSQDQFTTIVRNFVDRWNEQLRISSPLDTLYFEEVDKVIIKNTQ